ncbi:hypothetical protein KNE206_54340 [Kitasatospora sp. NE20-6]
MNPGPSPTETAAVCVLAAALPGCALGDLPRELTPLADDLGAATAGRTTTARTTTHTDRAPPRPGAPSCRGRVFEEVVLAHRRPANGAGRSPAGPGEAGGVFRGAGRWEDSTAPGAGAWLLCSAARWCCGGAAVLGMLSR